MKKIFIDNSGYHLRNLGDIAMLQIAVKRLQKLFPSSELNVLTSAPHNLRLYCPGSQPFATAGRDLWLQTWNVFGGLHLFLRPLRSLKREMYSKAVDILAYSEMSMRLRYLHLCNRWISYRLNRRNCNIDALYDFFKALVDSDLVLSTGGGFVTDPFKGHACRLLNTLAFGKTINKPVAMLGQGFGPIQDAGLRRIAEKYTPMYDLIALREGKAGKPLLRTFGVAEERILTTGDDAIELSYNERQDTIGTGIGINIRLAEYSNVDPNSVVLLREGLKEFQRRVNQPLTPIPIDLDSDPGSLRALVQDFEVMPGANEDVKSPIDAIKRISNCRIVITGSYHAGVFALAQGIPVVGLAKSSYYRDKFAGLADQFGCGCELVNLDDSDLKTRLLAAFETAWNSAEVVRAPLRAAAEEQIQLSQAAYQRVANLVKQKQ